MFGVPELGLGANPRALLFWGAPKNYRFSVRRPRPLKWQSLLTLAAISKPGRLFFPRVAFKGHIIASLKQRAHVGRIELFFVNHLKASGNIGQVVVNAIPAGYRINAKQITHTLSLDQ